ncbi:Uncharacterised protein [Mycobacteroides abscessus subsp. abscessus]|nr:Uncharacterised protein [Mycobacteroides abscessus subsp. abscessus]
MKYVVVVPPRELVSVTILRVGTIFGLVKAIAVWPVARPAMALATANRLSGRSGQSAMLSYAEMNWSVWY